MIALFSTKRKDSGFFRSVVDDGLRVVVIVEFVANLYAFPLYIELVLVPLTFFAVALQAVAEMDAQYAAMRKLMVGFLIVLGVVVLSFSIEHVVRDFGNAVTGGTVRAFPLAPALTIAFVPFLYAFALATQRAPRPQAA